MKKIDSLFQPFQSIVNGLSKMEQLNYHKLVNMKKRFEKYDCEIGKEFQALIEKHLILEKEKSRLKDLERRSSNIFCEFCGKRLSRLSIYKHKKTVCFFDKKKNDEDEIL